MWTFDWPIPLTLKWKGRILSPEYAHEYRCKYLAKSPVWGSPGRHRTKSFGPSIEPGRHLSSITQARQPMHNTYSVITFPHPSVRASQKAPPGHNLGRRTWILHLHRWLQPSVFLMALWCYFLSLSLGNRGVEPPLLSCFAATTWVQVDLRKSRIAPHPTPTPTTSHLWAMKSSQTEYR